MGDIQCASCQLYAYALALAAHAVVEARSGSEAMTDEEREAAAAHIAGMYIELVQAKLAEIPVGLN